MEIKFQLVFLVLLFNFSLSYAYFCPPLPDNGHEWAQDYKKGIRCILHCKDGFKPSSCHVIRKENGKWNYEIPQCIEGSPVSLGNVATGLAAGTVAVVGAPFALSAVGFTSAGVAAGSVAASLQGSATVAGSLFALCQSAGAAGLALTTKAAIGGLTAVTGGVASEAYDVLRCEWE